MVVTELVAKFSFRGNIKPIERLNKGLTAAVGTIAKVTSAFSVAGLALNGYLASVLDSADAMAQLSRETKVGVEAIQELGYVASVNGSSVQALESSIKNLSQKIGEAAIQGNADFARLGISIYDSMGHVKNAEQILMELSNRFKQLGLTVQEQRAYLQRLGIDTSLLQMLNLGAAGIDKLRQKARLLGVVTQDQANMITSFNDSLTTLKYGLNAIQKQIAIAFAPQMKHLTDEFTNFLIANHDVIENGLKKFFEVVNKGLGIMWRFGAAMYKIVDDTVGVKNALLGISAVMFILNKNLKRNLIVALILAIVAVIDDLNVALKGGKSAINEWLKAWFNTDVKTLLKNIKREFMDFVNFVGQSAEKIEAFFKPILDTIDRIEAFVSRQFNSVDDVKLKSGPLDPVSKQFLQKNPLYNTDAIYNKVMPFGNITKSTTSNIQHNEIKIEIKTDDPKTAGKAVADELNGLFSRANYYFNKGGR